MCIHYSMMGNREKEQGAQHGTHKAHYRNLRESKIRLAVVETVPEYEEGVVQKELGPDWKVLSIRMDPRCLGLPTSRARVFMLCWRAKDLRWVAPFTFSSFFEVLVSKVVMDASHYFYKKLPKAILSPSAVPWLHYSRVSCASNAASNIKYIGSEVSSQFEG